MTDKVQKIKEWIQIRKLCTMDEHMKFYCKEAESDYNILCSIEKVLDSQQEVPVSKEWIEELREKLDSLSKEDFKKVFDKYAFDFNKEPMSENLEKAAKECAFNLQLQEYFKKGAQWQKEQILAKAVDVTIAIPYPNGYGGYTQLVDSQEALPFGENIKVLVIKED